MFRCRWNIGEHETSLFCRIELYFLSALLSILDASRYDADLNLWSFMISQSNEIDAIDIRVLCIVSHFVFRGLLQL